MYVAACSCVRAVVSGQSSWRDQRVDVPRNVFYTGIPCWVTPRARGQGSVSELSEGEGVAKGRDFRRDAFYC